VRGLGVIPPAAPQLDTGRSRCQFLAYSLCRISCDTTRPAARPRSNPRRRLVPAWSKRLPAFACAPRPIRSLNDPSVGDDPVPPPLVDRLWRASVDSRACPAAGLLRCALACRLCCCPVPWV